MMYCKLRYEEETFDAEAFVKEYSPYYFGNKPEGENTVPCCALNIKNTTNEYVEKVANALFENGIEGIDVLRGIEFYAKTVDKDNIISFNEEDVDELKAKAVFFVLAWKKGCINHPKCKDKEFVFYSNCSFDSEKFIGKLNNGNIEFNRNLVNAVFDKELADELTKEAPSSESFNKAFRAFAKKEENVDKGRGIDLTYAAALVFYISRKNYPIYDKYASYAQRL